MWPWSKRMDNIQWYWEISHSGCFSNWFWRLELSYNQPRINLKTFLSWSMVRWMKTKRKFKICLIQTDLIKFRFDVLIFLILKITKHNLTLRFWNKSLAHWQNWAPVKLNRFLVILLFSNFKEKIEMNRKMNAYNTQSNSLGYRCW